jgi:hypothetical protein
MTNKTPISVLPPGVDQHEAVRGHTADLEKRTNAIMKNQTAPRSSANASVGATAPWKLGQ